VKSTPSSQDTAQWRSTQGAVLTAALCPGSFDPPTNGHLDVINRAIEVFDRLVVGVVHNPSKTPFFAAEERVALLDEMVGGRAEVQAFEGLLVDFARVKNVDVVVKGLRAISDFDYELQMAQMNYTLAGMETLFIPTNPQWSYLSSSLVREVARLGGDVDTLVPDNVAKALRAKVGKDE
jgi:pantetheine-phosphate adenylyltransferase